MKKFFTRKKVQVSGPPVGTMLPTSVQMPWQRIILSLAGILCIYSIWERATNHLYTIPPASVSSFTSITNNCFYAITILVVFFVTGKVFFDWKNSTVTEVIQQAQNITEERTERIVKPKYLDADDVT